MEKSEDNEYSREFVDGVISDYMARKRQNTNNPDAYNSRVITRMAGANPGAAPANNNRQTAGQGVTTDRDSAGKPRINLGLYVNANPKNSVAPEGLAGKRIYPAKAPSMRSFPDPPPCDPLLWCSDQYDDMKKGCLNKPNICTEGARQWLHTCLEWAGKVGDDAPDCLK
jgi:hypothetical protein